MASILDTLIDITFEGRTLQLRPNQLTVDTISRAFRLIPETILLISDRGTIAVPQEGEFSDVDELYSWAVEGDKVTTHSNMRNTHRDRPQSAAVPVTAVAKWKPPQASRPKSNGVMLQVKPPPPPPIHYAIPNWRCILEWPLSILIAPHDSFLHCNFPSLVNSLTVNFSYLQW